MCVPNITKKRKGTASPLFAKLLDTIVTNDMDGPANIMKINGENFAYFYSSSFHAI